MVPQTAFAQSTENTENSEIDEIVVTGSYIKRDPSNSASPLAIIDRETFEDLGIANPIDFVRFLTINTGSEFNPDIFTVGGTAGTSQYNLRGLGLGSTLTLLNGRRAVGAGSNASFVDINTLMPQIAVERVEILKDGASSLYGSLLPLVQQTYSTKIPHWPLRRMLSHLQLGCMIRADVFSMCVRA